MGKFVEWSNQLSVGIEEIDEQHKVLAGMVNEMHDAIQQRQAQAVVRGILDRLASYTQTHFVVEESLMRILNYPNYEAHKQEHDNLIEQIKELQGRLNAGSASINFELMHFLKVWLTKHIMESDKAYTKHFLAAGASAKLHKPSWVAKLWGSLHG
jgi:hemerythrin